MQFGFIGLGNMGAPIARNILKAGEQLMVFSSRPDCVAGFVAAGATVASTRQELASCDVLCTCLPLPNHVTELVLGENGLYSSMKKGSIHVEFSTIDPKTAGLMSKAAAELGIAYVQATVSKTPEVAEKGEAPLFIGGEPAIVEKLMPVFERIGKPRDVGSVYASCAVKLLSNLIGMSNLAVLSEGMRIGRLAGMDMDLLIELLQDTGARSTMMDVRGPWIARDDFAARFGVDLAAKDLRLGCAMAREWGYEPSMIAKALEYYEEAGKAGFGEEDCCAVSKITKP